jgi:histone H3/H4
MGDILVVSSKIKEAVKATGKSMSSGFPEAISKEVDVLIEKAVNRASENGRATVMAKDV